MAKYRLVSNHPEEVTVGAATYMAAPGAFVDISDNDTKVENNARLIEEGLLVTFNKKVEVHNEGGE